MKVRRVGRWGSTYTYELTVQEAHEIWTHLMTLANRWQPGSVDAETVRVGRELLKAAGVLDMAIMGAQRRSDDDQDGARCSCRSPAATVRRF